MSLPESWSWSLAVPARRWGPPGRTSPESWGNVAPRQIRWGTPARPDSSHGKFVNGFVWLGQTACLIHVKGNKGKVVVKILSLMYTKNMYRPDKGCVWSGNSKKIVHQYPSLSHPEEDLKLVGEAGRGDDVHVHHERQLRERGLQKWQSSTMTCFVDPERVFFPSPFAPAPSWPGSSCGPAGMGGPPSRT